MGVTSSNLVGGTQKILNELKEKLKKIYQGMVNYLTEHVVNNENPFEIKERKMGVSDYMSNGPISFIQRKSKTDD